MEIQQVDILLRLVIAHMLADFVFRIDADNKKTVSRLLSKNFLIHTLSVGVFTYLLLPGWTNIFGPIIIMLAHALIDLVVLRFVKNKTWSFIADQTLLLFMLFLYWMLSSDNSLDTVITGVQAVLLKTTNLVIITAYLAITFPVGALMAHLTSRWQDEIKGINKDSLKNAGKWIGISERILVLTFILLDQWAAIGFLLGAKSVLRFGDIKDGLQQKKTEYILIGTFLSFLFSIAVGIFTVRYLHAIA